ncbi:uncharacterized protein MYCFIDRAFT_206356 [Pseudocercospora fijiensis CIRAD86]|uniref:N,N-dimethylformamidase beta subunit-like C-terminal domain-containing protein n=1 Tax=Pseudocercospora fijiensis (strain CIRAD86) TaxID=383855 RepID=N1QCX8_PSEFD|nr:uncharacterized protein MYCFIDRAFT_206356 [Pseudocercospora fijiensis CIRAD86]EME89443.1 hypothetical protein MYCFIDRAFT_206356 [Pseudocercospora fijiensis CIRAD86]
MPLVRHDTFTKLLRTRSRTRTHAPTDMSLPSGHEHEIIGYVEPWIASPGESVAVSSTDQEYRCSLVRLVRGLTLKHAPPRYSEVIIAEEDSRVQQQHGSYKRAAAGSYALVRSWPPAGALAGVQFSFYLQPWLVDVDGGHEQTLVSTLDVCSRAGFALILSKRGTISSIVGDGRSLERHDLDVKPRRWRWLHIEVTIHDCHLSIHATHVPRLSEPAPAAFRKTISLSRHAILAGRSPLTLAAGFFDPHLNASSTHRNCFNGKVDNFRIDVAAESPGKYRAWAKYDFSQHIPTDRIIDTSGLQHHGLLVNAPARGVKGHDWDGSESDWTKAEYGYGAIHFHEDDLDDAAWDTDFVVQIPDHVVSGAYAVLVRGVNTNVEDAITFFVTPSERSTKPKVAMVMPTFTYLAYANERMHDQSLASRMELAGGVDIFETEHYRRMVRRTDLGLSTYDVHKDGSANVFSSAKRPILNMRPDYVHWAFHRPREFSADLLMLGFLESKLGKGGYDVVTEHDLHIRGLDAVKSYDILITGSHPEYPSLNELDAYVSFVAQGGYVMYLGGNGFYWCSETDPNRPHRMEVRKGDQGCRSVTLPAGERIHSLSGAQGGLWRSRGRAPQTLFGVGADACGSGPGVPYRFEKSIMRDSKFSWLFDGLESKADELLIGRQGFGGGASGDEIDRLDYDLGTPENAVLLATSTGHDETFCLFNEEVMFPLVNTLGPQTDRVRSDMVIYETNAGGAVFSVGSINWYCSLGWNAYQNDIAMVTWNVLKEFLRRGRTGKDAKL